MSQTVTIVVFLCGIFFGMLGAFQLGRLLGRKHRQENPAPDVELSTLDGAVFGLLGLLIAFTFAGAASRFEDRRNLIVEESNAIGTAYLRLNLVPAAARDELQAAFRRYVDSRLAFYHSLQDPLLAERRLSQAAGLQRSIWTRAVTACADAVQQPTAAMLLLPALNAMIDVTTKRSAEFTFHTPKLIFGMLGLLSICCTLFAGFGGAGAAKVSTLHSVGFALILTLTIYVILDLEYPRRGLIRLDATDQLLVDVRTSMR